MEVYAVGDGMSMVPVAVEVNRTSHHHIVSHCYRITIAAPPLF